MQIRGRQVCRSHCHILNNASLRQLYYRKAMEHTTSVQFQTQCCLFLIHSLTHYRSFDYRAGGGIVPTSVGSRPDAWLAARMADFTSTLHLFLSWMLVIDRPQSLASLSASSFQDAFGLPAARFPVTSSWYAIWIAPLDLLTCPYQRSRLSRTTIDRSSRPRRTSSSFDLTEAMSLGFTLHMSNHSPVISL